MGQYFRHLRVIPWIPKFKWVDSIAEAADVINRPHEDYPTRIPNTIKALEIQIGSIEPTLLLETHKIVFGDTSHGGQFRNIDVRVGNHIAPRFIEVASMMDELYLVHNPLKVSEESLTDWYTDFETIHPFQDGNGRVGGIVVARYSHLWFPQQGWLVPGQ